MVTSWPRPSNHSSPRLFSPLLLRSNLLHNGHIRPFSNMLHFLLHHKWSSLIIQCHICSSLHGDNASIHTIPFHFWSHIFQLYYDFNRHLKNLSLITHVFYVSSDLLTCALCPFDGNRCAQTLCAVTGFMSSVYESSAKGCGDDFISRPRTASTLAWALVWSSWIRGKIRNSRERLNVLLSSIATKIIGYVRHTVQ